MDPFDREGIADAIRRRLYGMPIERAYLAVEVRLRPVAADGTPDPGAETVLVSGVGSFEPEDDSVLPPAASRGEIVATVERSEQFAHRIEWRPDPRGVAYRATLAPGVTLSAEQVAELRRLAAVEPVDEWTEADAFAALAEAVLRMIGGGS